MGQQKAGIRAGTKGTRASLQALWMLGQGNLCRNSWSPRRPPGREGHGASQWMGYHPVERGQRPGGKTRPPFRARGAGIQGEGTPRSHELEDLCVRLLRQACRLWGRLFHLHGEPDKPQREWVSALPGQSAGWRARNRRAGCSKHPLFRGLPAASCSQPCARAEGSWASG